MENNESKTSPIAGDIEIRDTTPPTYEDIELTDIELNHGMELPDQSTEQRAAERLERINSLLARVLPAVKARNIGLDPRHPWLSNPHVEETVKATIEILYDLEVK